MSDLAQLLRLKKIREQREQARRNAQRVAVRLAEQDRDASRNCLEEFRSIRADREEKILTEIFGGHPQARNLEGAQREMVTLHVTQMEFEKNLAQAEEKCVKQRLMLDAATIRLRDAQRDREKFSELLAIQKSSILKNIEHREDMEMDEIAQAKIERRQGTSHESIQD